VHATLLARKSKGRYIQMIATANCLYRLTEYQELITTSPRWCNGCCAVCHMWERFSSGLSPRTGEITCFHLRSQIHVAPVMLKQFLRSIQKQQGKKTTDSQVSLSFLPSFSAVSGVCYRSQSKPLESSRSCALSTEHHLRWQAQFGIYDARRIPVNSCKHEQHGTMPLISSLQNSWLERGKIVKVRYTGCSL
jgi:hypothetical protein